MRPDGTLRVTVPRGGSRREAEAFVAENHRWIERERRRVEVEHASRDWQPGHGFLLRGVLVTIAVTSENGVRLVTYAGRRIAVPSRTDTLRDAIEADLKRIAEAELIPRLHELAARHGLTVRTVSIRNQCSRWGSCGRSGKIALNFRLVQMPPDVRDYVLIHELMHLRQQNHSRRFWRLVAAACPDYLEAERWLRTRGRGLF